MSVLSAPAGEAKARTAAGSWTLLLAGGFVVAALEALNAAVAYSLVRGVPPIRIFQGVAVGLLGREAYSGGWTTAGIGAALHYLISVVVVAVYAAAASGLETLRRHWVAWGLAYGAAVFLFMGYVVVPLSAHGGAGRFVPAIFFDGLIGDALLVGVPAAWFARQLLARRRAGG